MGKLEVAATVMLISAGLSIWGYSRNFSEREKERSILERGYLAPSGLEEPKLMDLHHDGNLESVIKYNGRTFLAKVDTNGTPYFVPIK